MRALDRVTEEFGWPMGPALLVDTIGLDVMVHADKVLQDGYPSRMRHHMPVVVEHLYVSGLLGQKKGAGFYEYGQSTRGPRPRELSAVAKLFLNQYPPAKDISDHQIIGRLMAPLGMEAVRCLDEGIVANPGDADLGAILGLGFPRFRSGPLRYIDQYGLKHLVETVRHFHSWGRFMRSRPGFYRETLIFISELLN